jgi:hypothetical protein
LYQSVVTLAVVETWGKVGSEHVLEMRGSIYRLGILGARIAVMSW